MTNKRVKRFGIISENYVRGASKSTEVAEEPTGDLRIFFKRADFAVGAGSVDVPYSADYQLFDNAVIQINEMIAKLFDMNAPLTPTESAVHMLQDIQQEGGGGGGISAFAGISTSLAVFDAGKDITFQPHIPVVFTVFTSDISAVAGFFDLYNQSAGENLETYVFYNSEILQQFMQQDHSNIKKLEPVFIENSYGYFDPNAPFGTAIYQWRDDYWNMGYAYYWTLRSRFKLGEGTLYYNSYNLDGSHQSGPNTYGIVNMNQPITDYVPSTPRYRYIPRFGEGGSDVFYASAHRTVGTAGKTYGGHKEVQFIMPFEATGDRNPSSNMFENFNRSKKITFVVLNRGEDPVYLQNLNLPIFQFASEPQEIIIG